MDEITEEKRRQNRIKQHSFLRINDRLALLLDISANGMRLACQDVPGGPEVEIKLTIGGKLFLLKGELRWFSEKNGFSGLHDLGVFFEDPPEKYVKQIDKILG